MYHSNFNLIYQEKPNKFIKNKQREDGWTDSVKGYCSEAYKWVNLVCINANHLKITKYHLVTILPREVQTAKEVSSYWLHVRNNLKALELPFLMALEPNRRNIVHAHCLIQSDLVCTKVKRLVKSCCPVINGKVTHVSIGSYGTTLSQANYVFKAKIGGCKNGKYTDDRYKYKRLLFIKRVGFKKVYYSQDYFPNGLKTILCDLKAIRAAHKPLPMDSEELFVFVDWKERLSGLLSDYQMRMAIRQAKERGEFEEWFQRITVLGCGNFNETQSQ